MVQYQRLIIHHGRKDERFRVSAEEGGGSKKAKQKFLSLLFLSILSCCFIMSPYLFGFSTLSFLGMILIYLPHKTFFLLCFWIFFYCCFPSDSSLISLSCFILLQIRLAEKAKVLVLMSHSLPLSAQMSPMVSILISFSKYFTIKQSLDLFVFIKKPTFL